MSTAKPQKVLANSWYVYAGSFKSKRNAKNLVRKLKSMGIKAFLKTTKKYNIVMLGGFEYRPQAALAMTELQHRTKIKGYLKYAPNVK